VAEWRDILICMNVLSTEEVTFWCYRPNENSKGKRTCSEGTDVLFKAKRETCARNPDEELKILSV